MSRKAHQIPLLKDQVRTALREKCVFGQSKHRDMRESVDTRKYIYSHQTYANYFDENMKFVKWCRHEYGCKTLEQCEGHSQDYIKHEIERGMSASTVKKRAAAIGKLYGKSVLVTMETPDRHRADIVRSRNQVPNDRFFSEDKHKDFVEFCRSTGLRRHELRGLKCEQLAERDGQLMIEGVKGKGGKVRDVPICGDKDIVRRFMSDTGLVFKEPINKNADIHSYRADYACRLYRENAPEGTVVPREARYHCRGDMRGTVFDKRAMQGVSWALGHNRIEIIASNYLYGLNAGS